MAPVTLATSFAPVSMQRNPHTTTTPFPDPASSFRRFPTWKQPKIRIHQPPDSPPRDLMPQRSPLRQFSHVSVNSSTDLPRYPQTPKSSSRTFKNACFRISSPTDKNLPTLPSHVASTPVTKTPTPRPLKFRIAGAQSRQPDVRRRLFPTSSPPKRLRHDSPSIRVSCGRARTQPIIGHPSSSHLVDRLDAAIKQANRNLQTFQEGLQGHQDTQYFHESIESGLLLFVSGERNSLLVLNPLEKDMDEQFQNTHISLTVTAEMLPKGSAPEQSSEYVGQVLYVPYPWHVQITDPQNVGDSAIVLAAHKIGIFAKSEFLLLVQKFEINSGLQKYLPQQELCVTSRPQSELRQSGKDSNVVHITDEERSSPSTFLFRAQCTHVRQVNILASVEFYDEARHLALIADDSKELAILAGREVTVRETSEKQMFHNVSVAPYQISPSLILEVGGGKLSNSVQSVLSNSKEGSSLLVFQCNRERP